MCVYIHIYLLPMLSTVLLRVLIQIYKLIVLYASLCNLIFPSISGIFLLMHVNLICSIFTNICTVFHSKNLLFYSQKHLSYFQFLAAINQAIVNILAHIFFAYIQVELLSVFECYKQCFPTLNVTTILPHLLRYSCFQSL